MIGSGRDGGGPPLSERIASLLREVADPILEVGPGFSTLEALAEVPLGEGPLVAIASGVLALERKGWNGPTVVLASDLPRLELTLVQWLANCSGATPVVPVVDGRPQYLCALYDWQTLRKSVLLTARGVRSMLELLRGSDHRLAGPDEWEPIGITADMFMDVDTPADLAHYRSTVRHTRLATRSQQDSQHYEQDCEQDSVSGVAFRVHMATHS